MKQKVRASFPATESYDFEDGLNLFQDIPAMSNDGMISYTEGEDPSHIEKRINNELLEDEHEDMVLDRGTGYKMVSIMRQKRALVPDPY